MFKKKIFQVTSLFSSTLLAFLIQFVISMVITRYLKEELYGDYTYIMNTLLLVSSIVSFGVFHTLGKMIADDKNKDIKHKLFGATIGFTFLMSVLMCLLIFGITIFKKGVGEEVVSVLYFAIPVLCFLPFRMSLEHLLQADNRIYSLSVFRILPKIFLLIVIFSFSYLINASVLNVVLANLITLGLVELVIYLRLKPSFQSFKKIMTLVFKENKKLGLPIFLGSITGVISSYLYTYSISYYLNNVYVGYFSLAITSTMVLNMIPATIGTTLFKDFAIKDRIHSKTLLVLTLVSLLSLVGFWLLIGFVFTLAFPQFITVLDLRLPYYLAIGSLIHGMGDFYNKFLYAKGKGGNLRNTNFILAIINVGGYFLLVKYFAIEGAVLTRVLSSAVYLVMMLFYYRKFLRR